MTKLSLLPEQATLKKLVLKVLVVKELIDNAK